MLKYSLTHTGVSVMAHGETDSLTATVIGIKDWVLNMLLQMCDQSLSISFILVITYYFLRYHTKITHITTAYPETF